MGRDTKGKLKKVFGYIEDSNGNVLFHQSDLFTGYRTVKEVDEIVNRIIHTWNNFDEVVRALKFVLSDKAKLPDGRISAECICKISLALNRASCNM